MHAFLLAVTLAAATGGARSEPAPKHIDIDDDEVIEGGLAKNEGDAILARKKERFQSLIKLREDFRRELFNSADTL